MSCRFGKFYASLRRNFPFINHGNTNVADRLEVLKSYTGSNTGREQVNRGKDTPICRLMLYDGSKKDEAISLLVPGTITTPTFPVLCRQPPFSLACLLYNTCINSCCRLSRIGPLVSPTLKEVGAALKSHLGSMLISLLLDKTRSY